MSATSAAPRHAAPGGEDREPILRVDKLQMYFPVKSRGIVRRTVGRWVR